MSRDFRNFTISNARNSDIDRFKEIQKKAPDKLAHQAFAIVLDAFTNKPATSPAPEPVEGAATEELKNEITEAKTENAELKKALADATEKIAQLQAQLTEAENVKLKTVEGAEAPALKLNPKAFVFEPTDAQHQQMRRVISYLIKQGKMQRNAPDLPQQFTAKAINYLVKNEFEHILK